MTDRTVSINVKDLEKLIRIAVENTESSMQHSAYLAEKHHLGSQLVFALRMMKNTLPEDVDSSVETETHVRIDNPRKGEQNYSMEQKITFRDIFVQAQDTFLADQVLRRQEQKASEDVGGENDAKV